MSTQTPVEPGWYPDPYGEARLRYWDGAEWTSHVDGQAAAPAPTPPPEPAPYAPPPAAGGETVLEPIVSNGAPPAPAVSNGAPPAPVAQVGAHAGPNGPVITPGAGGPYAPPPPFHAAGKSRALPILIGLVAVAAIGAVVAVVLLSSNSSKAADENAIRTTLATYDSTNDGKTACAQLAPSLLAQKPNCAENLNGAGEGTFARDKASVRSIKIHGKSATAVLGITAAHGLYKLERTSGKWRIADGPQAGLPSG